MLMLEEMKKSLDIESDPDESFEDNNDPLAEFGYEPI
jgi:hypothetical protein